MTCADYLVLYYTGQTGRRSTAASWPPLSRPLSNGIAYDCKNVDGVDGDRVADSDGYTAFGLPDHAAR